MFYPVLGKHFSLRLSGFILKHDIWWIEETKVRSEEKKNSISKGMRSPVLITPWWACHMPLSWQSRFHVVCKSLPWVSTMWQCWAMLGNYKKEEVRQTGKMPFILCDANYLEKLMESYILELEAFLEVIFPTGP